MNKKEFKRKFLEIAEKYVTPEEKLNGRISVVTNDESAQTGESITLTSPIFAQVKCSRLLSEEDEDNYCEKDRTIEQIESIMRDLNKNYNIIILSEIRVIGYVSTFGLAAKFQCGKVSE